jgi:hypothetical protein
VRIGTWNLEGRWGGQHERLLLAQDCDAWLLTEVRETTHLEGYDLHLGTAVMSGRKRWAAVATRGLDVSPLPDPHPASAAVDLHGTALVSSVLPWRGSGGGDPWSGDDHAARTGGAVDALLAAFPSDDLVWGGDWNHSLHGRDASGSGGGLVHVRRLLEARDLQVPTARLPHRHPELLAIDHVAVPSRLRLQGAWWVSAVVDGAALSDHDLYVVQVESL